MIIELNDELQQEESLLALMKQAGELCLKNEGLDFSDETTEVSLSFVSPEEIREINREYRDKDAVTDVLSFPQYNDQDEIREEVYACLGDVIICPERAREQAEEYGHSYTREMVYLMVHSMLHLLGYAFVVGGTILDKSCDYFLKLFNFVIDGRHADSNQSVDESGDDDKGCDNCQNAVVKMQFVLKKLYDGKQQVC